MNYKKDKSYIKQRLEYVNSVDYISELEEQIENLQNENKRLNNIIDKLEKEFNRKIELNYYHNGERKFNQTLTQGALMYRDYIEELLIELKEGE